MNRTRDDVLGCPYCGRSLHWVPGRWFGRGCFECDQCGEFPDLRHTAASAGNADQSRQTRSRIPPKGDRPRVLLVDDSAEQNDLYALMLEPTASVITASSGKDALAIATADQPDAIVLDILMPGMDGWDVCRHLKNNPITAAIPVIMLTGLEDAELKARARRVGAGAVLTKPCPAERLALAIAVAVQPPPTAVRQATPSLRVLIVASEDATCMEVRDLLSAAGYEVTTAGTFPEGKRLLQADAPDLLIAEVRLGEFNGLHLVAMTRSRIPTIILSGFSDAGFEADARHLGAQFLAKPIVPSAFMALVKRTLGDTAAAGSTRRWTRKPVEAALSARIDQLPSCRTRIVNVSRGGLCVEIEEDPSSIPRTFDLTVPFADVSIRADAVWMRRGPDQNWVCGAEIAVVNDAWLGLVDAIS